MMHAPTSAPMHTSKSAPMPAPISASTSAPTSAPTSASTSASTSGAPAIASNPSTARNCESPLNSRVATLLAVILPFVGLVAAAVLLWGIAFDWVHLLILVGMYLATALGITVGYHRLFTHRSFKTSPPVAAVLAALGSMAVQGPVLDWVGIHRRHHQHSDEVEDPHSPHVHGHGLWATARRLARGHRMDVPCPSRRHRAALHPRPAQDPVVPAHDEPALSRLGAGRTSHPHPARRTAYAELDRRPARLHLGRARPCVPGPPRDLEHQLRLPLWGSRPSTATTRAATTRSSACSLSARAGTTTTMPSPPPPTTVSAGGRWTSAT